MTATRTRSRRRTTTDRSRAAVRPLPQETTGPRLRVHPRRRVSGRALLGVGAAMFFVLLAGSVTIQAQRIEAQHRIDRLDQRLIAADDQHRELRADVAIAESPQRIMGAAAELGMVEPGPVLPLVPHVDAPPAAPSPTIDPPDGPATVGDGSVALGADRPLLDQKAAAGGE